MLFVDHHGTVVNITSDDNDDTAEALESNKAPHSLSPS